VSHPHTRMGGACRRRNALLLMAATISAANPPATKTVTTASGKWSESHSSGDALRELFHGMASAREGADASGSARLMCQPFSAVPLGRAPGTRPLVRAGG